MKVDFDIVIFCLLVFGLSWLGVELVKTEHYGWAWIPFLISASASYKSKNND